jgi:hypothetical protein
MISMPTFDDLPRSTAGSVEESRKAAKRAEQERAAQRQSELMAQASPENDPQRRIAIWERLHALSLPRRPDHPLVRLIAGQTGLTVREVCDEQGRRAASPLA